MAPATRRSSGLGSNANSPSNLDHILEHFNQFKRKHITQNRDIIKTNALAQLRIKELEEKVLALEAEQSKSNRDLIHVKRRLERAEKAATCMRQGWQLVGAGIAALSAVEGFSHLLENNASQTTNIEQSMYALHHGHNDAALLRPSTRITLDPNALPGGVARNVSRPPEAGLGDVVEERSAEMSLNERVELEDTAEHDDEHDSDDEGEEGNVVSFSADGEETIRMQSVEMMEASRTTDDFDRRIEADAVERNTKMDRGSRKLHHTTSIDSLSSFADDEEIELSTDDEHNSYLTSTDNHDVLSDSLRVPERSAGPSSKNKSGEQNHLQARGVARKRKTPNSPDDRVQEEQSQSETEFGDNDDVCRPSRRASMRDRKSINYALPKLNTKMRKPDPVDLIPAEKGESRRNSASTSPQHVKMDEVGTPYPPSSSAESSPNKRALKGKHEVASTGNLREIRRLHQEQQERQRLANAQTQSMSDAEPTTRIESEDQTTIAATSSSSVESPRRRSARNSVGRRRSSSSAQSESAHSNSADSRPQSRVDDSDAASSQEEDEDEGKPDETQLASEDERQKANKPMLSTPRWNANGSAEGAAAHSVARSLPMSVGTPIPKPTVRSGSQQGNIKALKVAGRMQKTPTTTTMMTGAKKQQGATTNYPISQMSNGKPFTPLGPAGGKANVVRSDGGQPRSFSTSAMAAAAAAAAAPNKSLAGQTPSSGDPTKRNSLHAAMTSNDLGLSGRPPTTTS